MPNNDDLFLETQLDKHFEELEQVEHLSSATPEARAYQRLKRFHATQATSEAQTIERVRQRLAARAVTTNEHRQSIELRGAPTLPLPIGTRRHLSRSRVLINTLAAVVLVGILVSGFALLMHTRKASTNASNLLPATGPIIHSNTWHVVPSPNIGGASNSLSALSVASGNDAWALGSADSISKSTPGKAASYASSPSSHATLAEHWDGRQWSIVPLPDGMAYLTGVVDVAPGDAWLSGTGITLDASGKPTVIRPLLEHWNGQQWSIVPSPQPESNNGTLTKLSARSSTDIWAVGYTIPANQDTSRPLVEHWNGQQWSIISTPGTFSAVLNSVSAISSNDVWAVGWFRSTSQQTLIEHWDGQQWKVVSSPSPGSEANYLTDITAISSDDVWAIGSSTSGNLAASEKTLIEHWDGKSWHIASSPNPSPLGTVLRSITALGPNDIWIAAFIITKQTAAPAGPDIAIGNAVIEHWDGQQWQTMKTLKQGNFQWFSAIARDPSLPGKIWIAGSYANTLVPTPVDQTLIETNF